MFDIREELKKLPHRPGVYLMYDDADRIIYVGKAVDLHRRVHQYFSGSGKKSPKIAHMVGHIARFETTVVDSETEALVLECNLIKEYHPKYNTMLTDDKTYPYIKVTMGEAFPRMLLTRKRTKDHSVYFGPYPDAGAAKDSLQLIRRIYRIRTCTRRLPEDAGKERPCLNYHIHQCDAPCRDGSGQEEYRARVEKAEDFLKGNYREVIGWLTERMQEASDRLDYEMALTCRDLIGSVRRLDEQQKIVDNRFGDRDILGCAADGEDAIVQVFFIRQGRMIGREHFHVQTSGDDGIPEILNDFVKQHYAASPFLPHEILVPSRLADGDVIGRYLSARAGHKVSVLTPQKGEKVRLVELAVRNAGLILTRDKDREKREDARTRGALRRLGTLLSMPDIRRVEAYDISHISGFAAVGSMVVFEDGRPKKTDYRKFRIRSTEGPDDYAALAEVLHRRLTHGISETEVLRESGVQEQYGRFSVFPDLILMDGGRGQVSAAEEVVSALGLDIPVCGMVKDDRHRTRGLYYLGEEVPLDRRSDEFDLITRIQDEAHRFAVEYHRNTRTKEQVHSILDDIEGIGPVRRKALMRRFRTREALAEAGMDDLTALPEMNRAAARRVYAFFHEGELPEEPREAAGEKA